MTMAQPYQAGQPPQYPAGWYADPQGRFEQRWFDGAAWTPHVMSGGVASVDAAAAAVAVPGGGAGWPVAGASTAWRSDGLAYGRRVNRNKIGFGLALGVVGLAVLAASWFVPWVGPDNLSNLHDIYTGTDPTPATILWQQFFLTSFWAMLAVIGTTLPYQPGKLVGFCLGTLIGLGVCWQKVDRHDPTTRVNVLVACVSPIWMFFLWYRAERMTHQFGRYEGASLGLGPYLSIGGIALVVIGAILGRRHVRVTV